MSVLFFILIALVMNVVVARRGLGVTAWILVALTFLAAVTVVLQLQAMVPESWSLGLWVIGVTSLMGLAIPLPALGKFAKVAKSLLATVVLAYPVWIGVQMTMVYFAIQADDPKTVNQRVDFEAMRAGVEEQLSSHFAAVDAARASMEQQEEGVIAGVKSMFSSGARVSRRWLVKRLVKSILTPEGLKRILNRQAGEARVAEPSWNVRLRIEDLNRWKLWTNAGWVGFEPGNKGETIQLRSIEFSEELLAQIEKLEDDVN